MGFLTGDTSKSFQTPFALSCTIVRLTQKVTVTLLTAKRAAASCPATVPLINFSDMFITYGIFEINESLYTLARNVAYKTISMIGVIREESNIPLSLKNNFLFLPINVISVLTAVHLPVFSL